MKHCLIADDSSVVRKVARRILEAQGFNISEAENGESAIALCRQAMPDGVLLDANMPVMDGFEFLTALRALPGGDVPKVVFLTTENDIGLIARAMRAGANDFVLKPFDNDIITKKFAEVGLL